MGTNFYTIKGEHIGKRSAAGLYCWDCNVSLCKAGKEHVHESPACGIRNVQLYIAESEAMWHKKCPNCGREPEKEDLDCSSAGRELGSNELLPHRKVGVQSCSSFTWAMRKERALKIRAVVDEQGKKYNHREFLALLEECPIQFYHSIGVEFT